MDNSVALEMVRPYKPLSGVQPCTRCLDYNSSWKPALVKLPYGAQKITFKALRKVKFRSAEMLEALLHRVQMLHAPRRSVLTIKKEMKMPKKTAKSKAPKAKYKGRKPSRKSKASKVKKIIKALRSKGRKKKR